MNQAPEFDVFSGAYDELLRDPVRDRFGGGGSQFFHLRKRDLVCGHFRRRRVDTRALAWLDLGCGKGELLGLLQNQFASVAGCDPSAAMMSASRADRGIVLKQQVDEGRIPFEDESFDFITAVCVYHHVPLAFRAQLTAEVHRVLKPGGTIAIIEHNPFNPITRLIVSRTPVDADAILLRSAETRRLVRDADFVLDEQSYFLYFPERVYNKLSGVESVLRRVPLGGQYAVFATKPDHRHNR